MPRPCSFDRDDVVDAALDAFWGSSFAATSTDDLCTATGLSRSSLYNSFGSKADLYQETLRRYAEVKDAERRAYLDGPGTGRERLARLVTDVLNDQQQFADRRACLVVNAAVEVGRDDPVVAGLARDNLQSFRDLLRLLIDAAQRDGSVRDDRSADDYAVLVHATLNGLQVAARVDADPAAHTRAADTLLALL